MSMQIKMEMMPEKEIEKPKIASGSLKWILAASLVSSIGYLLIGVWCLRIVFESSEALERLWPNALIIFAICRLVLLAIFLFESDGSIALSTFWTACSTLLMMAMYLTICLGIAVFYHAHVLLPPVMFLCLGFDFVSNVLAVCRGAAFEKANRKQ